MFIRDLVAEHGPNPHPVTPIGPEQLVDEAGGMGAVDWAEHDGDECPAGKDVDGRELVALAHALEIADVERIHADELARTSGGQQNRKGSSFLAVAA